MRSTITLRMIPALAILALVMLAGPAHAGCGHHGGARIKARHATYVRPCAAPAVTTGPGGRVYTHPTFTVPQARPASYAAPAVYASPSFQGGCQNGKCQR